MSKSKKKFRARSNTNTPLRRARSQARGKERRSARVLAQDAATVANRALRKAGLPTPWDSVEAERQKRRDADPEVQRRRKIHEAKTLS